MTNEEAKTKQCPYGFSIGSMCIGTRCALWKLETYGQFNPKTSRNDLPETEWRGHCGLIYSP